MGLDSGNRIRLVFDKRETNWSSMVNSNSKLSGIFRNRLSLLCVRIDEIFYLKFLISG